MSYREVTWKHLKTGGLYRITGFSVQESDLRPMVAYTKFPSLGDDVFNFLRPATEFFDGRFVVSGDAQPETKKPASSPVRVFAPEDVMGHALFIGDWVGVSVRAEGVGPWLVDREAPYPGLRKITGIAGDELVTIGKNTEFWKTSDLVKDFRPKPDRV